MSAVLSSSTYRATGSVPLARAWLPRVGGLRLPITEGVKYRAAGHARPPELVRIGGADDERERRSARRETCFAVFDGKMDP